MPRPTRRGKGGEAERPLAASASKPAAAVSGTVKASAPSGARALDESPASVRSTGWLSHWSPPSGFRSSGILCSLCACARSRMPAFPDETTPAAPLAVRRRLEAVSSSRDAGEVEPFLDGGFEAGMGMELNEILKVAVKGGASDIHLKSGLPPDVPRGRCAGAAQERRAHDAGRDPAHGVRDHESRPEGALRGELARPISPTGSPAWAASASTSSSSAGPWASSSA